MVSLMSDGDVLKGQQEKRSVFLQSKICDVRPSTILQSNSFTKTRTALVMAAMGKTPSNLDGSYYFKFRENRILLNLSNLESKLEKRDAHRAFS